MKVKVLKYKSDGNTVIAPYMELEAYAENVYISLSAKNEFGNENDDYFHVVLARKAAGKKPPVIAGTGLRIRFGTRKTGTISPFCPSVSLKDSGSIRLLCCKPVKHTGKSRNKGGGNRGRKRTRNAGWRKQNGNRPLMKGNKNSWTGMRLQRIFFLRLPSGTALKSISGPKARWGAM